ncbi:unnamed protein product [Brassica oleracea var. botrytis]
MPEFPILSLPAEVQALGVQRVAHNSFSDLYRLHSTCKSRCALVDDGGVYAAFDLFKYPWYVGKRNLLLRRCFEEGNPSTLYVKGVEYFYRLDRHVEGLALIKRPADAGFEQAICLDLQENTLLRSEWWLNPPRGYGIGIITMRS